MLKILLMMAVSFTLSFMGTWLLLELEERLGPALRRKLNLRPRPVGYDDRDLLTR